ncbi:precorrin-6y C5,15-methyltransferase (decarboxylating) subunit CbiE [Clostridium sp.]|uniref:precorrin-6y C5,15-methyltransferase (decarboxylating) subunit CbiE n=1 Tax=Clostridium sp. TaxID=1506 RepID=UPI0026DC8B10|nr:precorrin-6y C5,15-methyltransferase (decarboxylating) subunit CbiE [Clostridium sp.]MDO5038441.1 precorrin-6y C5,15-methyltransferase (decarboxylating) subunit CbiE [Clostridium sp.]
MVYIVGIGPGNKDYILPKAISTLNESDIIIGFSRALKSIEFLKKDFICVSSIKEIINEINKNKEKVVSVIASGDPLFYGITDYLKKNIDENIEVIPGISSFQYFASKVGIMWSKAYLSSLHGREDEFLKKVLENKITVWLTDTINTPKKLCNLLSENEVCSKVYIGENLSYEDEKITIGNPNDLKNGDYDKLSVIIIEHI